MAIKVLLKNKNTCAVKFGVLGFSWITLFFGAFIPLFRKDFKMFIPLALVYVSFLYYVPYSFSQFGRMTTFHMSFYDPGIFGILTSFYYLVVNVCGAFFYNYIYTKSLIKRGFYPVSSEGKVLLKAYHVYIPKDDC